VKRAKQSTPTKGNFMGGFDHQMPRDQDAERVLEPHHRATRNARLGMVLFLAYLAFYGAFVLINTFRPELMDYVPAAGVSLAIWYGFALIGVALVLALLYAWLCRGREDRVGPASNLSGRLETCPTTTEGRP
jgi:uncharacterized membrane protein (DUF485 family)